MKPLTEARVGEVWRPVVGWEAEYEVSTLGALRFTGGRLVMQRLNDQGYPTARLSRPRRTIKVHRLVAAAFVENPAAKPCVNHINNDRSDNRAENLEWCTQTENLAHMTRQGRRAKPWLDKRSPNAALTDEQVQAIRDRYTTAPRQYPYATLAAAFKTSKRTVGRIINGASYRSLPPPPSAEA